MLRGIIAPLGASRPGVVGVSPTLKRLIHQPKRNDSDTIHVLGLGNLGKYIAHSVVKQDSGPVTLLFHRSTLHTQSQSAGCAIQCITDGVLDKRSGFRVEDVPPDEPSRQSSLEPIKYLVVATKTYTTTNALKAVKDRLSSKASILFLQNGMVSAEIFPDPESRPAYWAGICSAGVYSAGSFTIVHAGRGPLKVGLMVESSGRSVAEHGAASTENWMIQHLPESGVLQTTVLTPAEIKECQIQKLVVNAIINPLTSIFRCQNGQLLGSPTRLSLIELLIKETGPVVRALLHTASDLFSNPSLLALVVQVAHNTGVNFGSMVQDVKAGRRTEIDYINGYIVAQGTRLGLSTPYKATIVRLVKEQRVIQDQHVADMFPVTGIL